MTEENSALDKKQVTVDTGIALHNNGLVLARLIFNTSCFQAQSHPS
jgi:hypothetical protein